MFDHFLEAQNPVYPNVLDELRSGYKRSHWMWFIFPQLKGLGSSDKSIRYAISDDVEAKAYWEHPILGKRLKECFDLVETNDKSLDEIFGPTDILKYRSCWNLFSQFIDKKSN